MSEQEIVDFLAETFQLCDAIEHMTDATIIQWFGTQTTLMGKLSKAGQMVAEATYYVNKKKGEIYNRPESLTLNATLAKNRFEGEAATELKIKEQAEKLYDTITKQLDQIRTRISAEKALRYENTSKY